MVQLITFSFLSCLCALPSRPIAVASVTFRPRLEGCAIRNDYIQIRQKGLTGGRRGCASGRDQDSYLVPSHKLQQDALNRRTGIWSHCDALVQFVVSRHKTKSSKCLFVLLQFPCGPDGGPPPRHASRFSLPSPPVPRVRSLALSSRATKAPSVSNLSLLDYRGWGPRVNPDPRNLPCRPHKWCVTAQTAEAPGKRHPPDWPDCSYRDRDQNTLCILMRLSVARDGPRRVLEFSWYWPLVI